MSENPYEAPSSEVGEQDLPQFSPVKKPWGRWLVVVWLFVTFSMSQQSLGISAARVIAPNPVVGQIIVLAPFLIVIILMFGVSSLKKPSIIVSAVFFVLVGAWHLAISAYLLWEGVGAGRVLTGVLVYVVPCCLAAWYLLRPGFLRVAAKHRNYMDRLLTQRYVEKQMRKGAR